MNYPIQLIYLRSAINGMDLLKADTVVEFIELSETGLLIELSNVTCQKGTKVEFSIDLSLINPDVEFESTGKIEEVEKMEEGSSFVSVKLVQYDHNVWTAILRYFEKKQEAAEELLLKVKGY